jgi:hypothetical protein
MWPAFKSGDSLCTALVCCTSMVCQSVKARCWQNTRRPGRGHPVLKGHRKCFSVPGWQRPESCVNPRPMRAPNYGQGGPPADVTQARLQADRRVTVGVIQGGVSICTTSYRPMGRCTWQLASVMTSAWTPWFTRSRLAKEGGAVAPLLRQFNRTVSPYAAGDGRAGRITNAPATGQSGLEITPHGERCHDPGREKRSATLVRSAPPETFSSAIGRG